MTSASVVRFPVRLRVISSDGLAVEKPCGASGVETLFEPKTAGELTLDVLLASGQIDEREHAAGLAYGGLRRRYKAASRSTGRDAAPALGDAAWSALSRRHAALIWAAGHEQFALDRLCLDDEAPLRCEVEQVGEVLGRVAAWATVAHA